MQTDPFAKGIVVIRSSADLNRFTHSGPRKNLRILLEIPGLPAEKTAAWETALNEQLRQCGCSLGAKFVVLGLALAVAYQFLVSTWQPSHLLAFLLRTLAFMLVGGIAGKVLGLSLARKRITEIEERLAAWEACQAPTTQVAN
jgi:hypothetical protein